MVIGYEADLEQARDVARDFKEQLVEKTSELAAAVEKVELLENVVDEHNSRASYLQAELEKVENKKNAEIASLQRRLAESEQMQASNLRKMREDLVARFQGKVDAAGEKISILKGDVTDNLMYLGQIDNNLQFIKEVQTGEISDLEAAKVELLNWRVPLADAHALYNETLEGVLSELVVSPISPCSPNQIPEDGPSETLAASVGVTDVSGTNEASPVIDLLIAEKNGKQAAMVEEKTSGVQQDQVANEGGDSEDTATVVA